MTHRANRARVGFCCRHVSRGMGALLALSIVWILPAQAELPAPNKLIALVQSAGCDMSRLRPDMEGASKAIIDDSRSTRVIVDWPPNPEHNVDLLGRPSAIMAALEVAAAPSALPDLADLLQHKLGSACHVGIYLVHERRFLTRSRTWRLGEASPQLKTLTMLVRKQGLTLEEFDRVWGGPHAEIALSWRAASGQSEGHYIQNLVLTRIGDDAPPLDGIGEGEGPGAGSQQEREARMKAAAHSQTFVDMTKATMFVARETVLKDQS